MPYVPQITRQMLAEDTKPMFPGELNYIISSIIDQYIEKTGLSYTTLNEIIGVLECAKMELYRRIAAPYEDKKLSENGEVYHFTMKKLYPPEPSSGEQLDIFPKTKQALLEQAVFDSKPATYGGGKFGSAKG